MVSVGECKCGMSAICIWLEYGGMRVVDVWIHVSVISAVYMWFLYGYN